MYSNRPNLKSDVLMLLNNKSLYDIFFYFEIIPINHNYFIILTIDISFLQAGIR